MVEKPQRIKLQPRQRMVRLSYMRTLVVDTNGIVKKLEASGFSRVQAEGITEAIKQLDVSSLATKHDLELALARQTTKLIIWMSGSLLAQAALVVAVLQYLR